MNNKLRQEILKELKFVLNEVENSTSKGFFNQDQDEVFQKIYEASPTTDDDITYLNLTDFGKMVNEKSLVALINSVKDADLDEFDATARKSIEKLCSTKIVLVDEYGSVDPYFYIKCRNNKPFSATRLGYEGAEKDFPEFIKRLEQGVQPTPDPAPTPAPGPTPPVPTPDSGQSTTGKGNVKCADEQAIVIYQQWLKYVHKKNVSVDGSYGPLTHAAAAAVLGEKGTFEQIKADPQRVCKFALEHKTEWSAAIQKANPKVKVGQKETGGAVRAGKPISGTNYASIEDAMAYVNVKASACTPEGKKAIEEEMKKLGIQPKGSEGQLKSISTQTIDALIKQKCQSVANPVKESKNYYDNKKLNEAKQLFNKLLKNL